VFRQNSQVQVQSGSTLGPYEVKKVIGTGGMGTVFLATQLSLGRDVALKVLKPHRLQAPGAAENFLAEASRTAQLNHPHLVSVHDAGRDPDNGMVYYAMTFVDGATLRKVVATHGPVDTKHALRIAHECALGLGHAHERGLVHRDFKPENVLISRDKRAMITDLGMAIDRLGGRNMLNSAKTLAIVGTPEYSAPEQCRNPGKAVPASDIYSLGCALYFMLTGQEPFDGETLIDLIVRSATEDPPLLGTLDSIARDVLQQLMAKSPTDRPPNGNAAAELIAAAMRGASVAKRQQAVRRRMARRRRR
jgi:serine/threonine protein kinase